MGMRDILSFVFGKGKARQAQDIAENIVLTYIYGRESGRFRLDDWLAEELERHMTHERMLRVLGDFQQRRARGIPEAETLLVMDIAVAIQLSEQERRKAQRVPEQQNNEDDIIWGGILGRRERQ